MMTEIQCEPEQLPGRVIFMSVYNDIVWGEKGNEEMCIADSQIVAECAQIFTHGHWLFLGPDQKRSGAEHIRTNRMKTWDRFAEDMMLNFSESGDPVFRGSSALERGDLKSKGKGNLSKHFCGEICEITPNVQCPNCVTYWPKGIV